MPFVGPHENEIGLETPEGPVCIHDVQDGTIKSAEDIFTGGVEFFMTSVAGDDRGLAERLTRKNMKALPYWQSRPFAELEGPVATDEEFGAAMAKL
jgi:hypothetical protein